MTIKVNRIDITDCAAAPASTFIAINSTDGGNNVNWQFVTSVVGGATASATASFLTSYTQQEWDDISYDANTWSDISTSSNTWTDINYNNNTWYLKD